MARSLSMMSDNISPPATARRSKLTKRRRYDDCTSTITKATTNTRTCSLQSLNNSSALVSTNSDSILQYSQQNQEQQQQPASAVGVSSSSKNDVNVKNHNYERHWKENLQNDSSSQPISSSSLKNLSSSIVAGRRTNDSNIGGGDELDYSTNSEKLTSSTAEQECSSSDGMTSNNIHNQSSSLLGFMDNIMQHSSPYIMSGINWKNYYYSSSSSSKRLELDIEKAFTAFSNNNQNIDKDNVNRVVNQKNEESTNRVGQYRVDHPLVGRIDRHDVVVTDINHNPSLSSFAFPSAAQCNNNSSSSTSNNKRLYPETTSTNSITLLRRHSKTTGLGISIPYSWYRFPQSKRSSTSSASSETVPLVKKNDNSCNVSDEIIDKQEVVNHCNDNQLVTNNTVIVHAIDKNLQSKTSSSSLPSSIKQQQQQPIGKIRIEPGQKATIREMYDIDKSNIIIGTLHAGTERYYYEKRTLPPPPISLLDDNEDDEEEDECVAVVRYKVALLHVDIIDRTTTISTTTTTSFIGKDNDSNNSEVEYPLVGWISDRGRFADDPYLILREI